MLNDMTDPSGSTIAWTTLAHLLRPQGRKGEILAELLTDFPERFEQQPRVFLAKPDGDAPTTPPREIKVSHHWLPVGRNHGRIVLAFEGVDSISLAEELSGYLLQIPAEERVELEDDAEYISDLIGCTVFDGAEKVGAVTGIDFPATADGNRRLPDAAPLLTVLTDTGDEVLIPYVQAFLVALAPEHKRIDMALPAGLIDLNRAPGGE